MCIRHVDADEEMSSSQNLYMVPTVRVSRGILWSHGKSGKTARVRVF